MIRLRKVERLGCWTCPACGGSPEGVRYHDGDTISHRSVGRGDYSEYDAMLVAGRCPACGIDVYNVEITVLAESDAGQEFINDNCFEAGEYTFHEATHNGLAWAVVHYRNVRFDHLHHYSGRRIAWMDRHILGPFIVEGCLEGLGGIAGPHMSENGQLCNSINPKGLPTWEKAAKLVTEITPELLRLKW